MEGVKKGMKGKKKMEEGRKELKKERGEERKERKMEFRVISWETSPCLSKGLKSVSKNIIKHWWNDWKEREKNPYIVGAYNYS